MSEKLNPSDQWAELNRILRNSRITSIGLVVVSLFLSICLLWQSFKPPIVIRESNDNRMYYTGHFKNVVVTNDDAELFIKKFVTYRYVWEKFTPGHIVNTIRPLVTEDFAKMLVKSLKREKKKMMKVKSIEQNVTNIKVTIEKGKALATFDKIIRVNGLPLVSPTQISLNLVKKDRTSWNPIGLYVHGIVEHNEK